MTKVVVVGGGFAGLSAAIRIAKLRHEVTLLESSDRLGGQLRGVSHGGHTWQVHPEVVTLPGVFRDLFRKSGRPMDQILGMSKIDGRRHYFPDKTTLDLPLGNRGDQNEALIAAFGQDDWSSWVDSHADVWDVIRRVYLDRQFAGRDDLTKTQWKALRPRRTMARVVGKDLKDERLQSLVSDPVSLAGDELRLTPGFVAVKHYVERNFGLWAFDGGRTGLADALTQRVAERKITVEYGAHATGLAIDTGVVRGVNVGADVVDAEHVVWASPQWPNPLPAPREMPRMPSARCYLRLHPDAPGLSDDIMIHGDPPLHLWTNGPGQWTVEHRGGEDPVIAMVRCGLDLRQHIIQRWDQSPVDLVTQGHWGWAWQGWSTALALPGVTSSGGPAGLSLAGAHAYPGPTLEMIGMRTAVIAETFRR